MRGGVKGGKKGREKKEREGRVDNGGEKNGDAFDDELFTALCSGFYVHFRFPPPPSPLPPADPQPSLSSFHLLFTSSLNLL